MNFSANSSRSSTAGAPMPRSSIAARLLVAALALLALALVVAFARLAWQSTRGGLRVQTLSVTVRDDNRTDVRFEVMAARDIRITCTARATAADGIEVGATTIALANGDDPRRVQVAQV